MQILIINEKTENLKGFINYLNRNLPNIKVSEFDKFYFAEEVFYTKTRMLLQILANFFCLATGSLFSCFRKYDFVILHGIFIALPYLILNKLLYYFTRPKKNIIITYFFIHSAHNNWLVQIMLRFLLKDKRIILTLHSKSDLPYFSEVIRIPQEQIVILPYCQDMPRVNQNSGKGKKYIFSGGFSNRDYECLLEAAKSVECDFIIACSNLNKIPFQLDNVRVLLNLDAEDFNGYLKNSIIAIIPLKDEVGSSGQAVALSAMSLSKAIIYTDSNFFAEYFFRGFSGIPYKRGNAVDLISKINYLLKDPQKREELGLASFNHYSKSFYKASYYKKLSQLFLRRYSNFS